MSAATNTWVPGFVPVRYVYVPTTADAVKTMEVSAHYDSVTNTITYEQVVRIQTKN